MQFEDLWYIFALRNQLKPNTVLARSLLGEWLAIFRGENGQAVALRDRCLHPIVAYPPQRFVTAHCNVFIMVGLTIKMVM